MKPAWDQLAGEFADSNVVIADADCTASGKSLCKTAGVRGYPTIKYYINGEVNDYKGGRDFNTLKRHVDTKMSAGKGAESSATSTDRRELKEKLKSKNKRERPTKPDPLKNKPKGKFDAQRDRKKPPKFDKSKRRPQPTRCRLDAPEGTCTPQEQAFIDALRGDAEKIDAQMKRIGEQRKAQKTSGQKPDPTDEAFIQMRDRMMLLSQMKREIKSEL